MMSIFSKPVYNNIKYPQPQYNTTSPVYGQYGQGYNYGPSYNGPKGASVPAVAPISASPVSNPGRASTKLPSFSELVTSIPLPNEFPLNRPGSEAGSPLEQTRQSSTVSLNGANGLQYYYGSNYSTPTPRQNSSVYPARHSVSPKTLLPTPPPANMKETKESKRKHVCKICSRSFTTSGHLARHNRIHTGERKHICPWTNCDARFARQDNCMQHYKTHTNGKKRKNILNFKNKSLNSKSI